MRASPRVRCVIHRIRRRPERAWSAFRLAALAQRPGWPTGRAGWGAPCGQWRLVDALPADVGAGSATPTRVWSRGRLRFRAWRAPDLMRVRFDSLRSLNERGCGGVSRETMTRARESGADAGADDARRLG